MRTSAGRRMDQYGVRAQVLYPNMHGSAPAASRRSTTRSYAGVRPRLQRLPHRLRRRARGRFVAIAALPFWDLTPRSSEMERCAGLGHRGIIFGADRSSSVSRTSDPSHWDRVWAAAQDMQMSVKLHIAAGDRKHLRSVGRHRAASQVLFGQREVLPRQRQRDVRPRPLRHLPRVPDLKFVSVESGVGRFSCALDAMDWMSRDSDVSSEHPEYDLCRVSTSNAVLRLLLVQDATAHHAIEQLGTDCILFETDLPRPNAFPGQGSVADRPPRCTWRLLR